MKFAGSCLFFRALTKSGIDMNLLLPLGTVASSESGNFATVLVFVLVGFAFAGIALAVAKILGDGRRERRTVRWWPMRSLPGRSERRRRGS